MVLITNHLSVTGIGLRRGMRSCASYIVEMKEKYSFFTKPCLSCEVQINNDLAYTTINVAWQNCKIYSNCLRFNPIFYGFLISPNF